MKEERIRQEFQFHDPPGSDIIKTPGQFEGEHVSCPYFVDLALDGFSDEIIDDMETSIDVWRITPEMAEDCPSLSEFVGQWASLQQSDQGFWHLEFSEEKPELTAAARFENAVTSELENIGAPVHPGLSSLCEACRDEYGSCCRHHFEAVHGEESDEGEFSHSGCDLCGTSLGGQRYAAHHWERDDPADLGELFHVEICADCVAYLANGDLPETWEE